MNIKNKRIKNALVIGLSLLLTSTIAVPKVFAEEELEEVEEIEVIEEITEEEEAITPPVEEVVEELVEETTPEIVVNTPTIRNFGLFRVGGVDTLVADVTTLADAFPDVNFRTWIVKNVLGNASYDDNTGSNAVLTTSDITKITTRTSVSVNDLGIVTMEGIQHFVNLTSLQCYNNQITELDVSNLTKLTLLYCNGNQISALDVSNLINLTNLRCQINQISELEVSNLTNLTTLQCHNNQISELDVSNLTNLTTFYCFGNQISELDVSNLTNLTDLRCYSNQISELDISKLTSLATLYCHNNQISELDVSKLINLTSLYCYNNQISELDVSYLTNLTSLQCYINQISELDLSRLDNLTNLQVYCNPISELVISDAAKSKITTLLYRSTNIETLDLAEFTSLSGTLAMTKSTNADFSQLKGLYVTGSRPYTDASLVRVLADVGSFSWDATTGCYVIPANCNATYGFTVNTLEGFVSVDNVMSLPNGGLMDDEGNLIVGATLADVAEDGTITLANGGAIVTPEGTFTTEGSVSIKDGIITTEDNYSFAKNTATYDSQTGTSTANIGDIVTYVEVGNGTASISTIGSEMSVPTGSVVTTDAGDKTYLIGEGTVDSEGNVTSSDIVITVPVDKVGEITTDTDGNIIFPEGSIVTINDEDVTYPGNIVYNPEDATIKYLPIDSLLTEDGTGLATGTDHDAIDEAQRFIDALPEGTLKEELQAKTDKAQTMLDANVALADLFDETGIIKDTTTQATIDNAQALVDLLPEGTLKTELQADIDKAQAMLDAKLAVADLFDETGIIKDTTTQATIDNAQALVDLLPEGTLKEKLQADIDKAEVMLDAKEAVADLFDETGTIKDTTTQATIDNAQAFVDVLPEGTLKTELQAEIDNAQAMLDAKDAVEALFDETGIIKDTTTQATIDNAQAFVDVLPEGTLKTELQAEIDKAQAMLDAKLAVADLFNETGTIKDTTTQATIDSAQAFVNLLPVGTLKTELQAEIDKAQAMLDAKLAVTDLFDGNGSIKDTTTQTTIDNAQKLVNKLPQGALKTELQGKIDDAQKQLDEKNDVKPPVITNPTVDGSSTTNGITVSTSDTTNIMAFISLLISSLAVIVFILKKKNERKLNN